MGGEFSNSNHLRNLSEERRDWKKPHDVAYESRTKGLLSDLQDTDKCIILRAKRTGSWMSICGNTVSDTVPSATVFRDFLCARYNISPLNLQSHCGGCGTEFEVMHTPGYIIGGLVIARHNKIRDKLFYLSRRAFTSAYVRAELLIHQVHTRSELEILQGSDKHEFTRGGVMIQGLWDCQVDAIIDVKIGDADADTYKYDPMTSLLTSWEKINKDKYGKHCQYK